MLSVLHFPYALTTVLVFYFFLLSRHLQRRHPLANPRPPPTAAEYEDARSYHDIDMLKAIPNAPTHTGYAIIGGSGFLGSYLTRLLLLRGESNIRILDLTPPSQDLLANDAVSFIPTDITSIHSLHAALSQKFTSTNEPPTVIFHMAAIIRFWERASYTWPVSHKINVQGTANILSAIRDMPSVRTLIYTSSGDVIIPRPCLWTLGYYRNRYPWNTVTRSDEDPPLKESEMHLSCYARSKKMAEDLVRAANGKGGLKTGILRPGYSIVGVNDRLISSTLDMPQVPIFDKAFSQIFVNAWDVAAAHLKYEEALAQRPDEVAGEAFIITGPHETWTLEDVRNAIRHYSSRPLIFQDVPPLAIFLLAHILELGLFIRWYILLPLYALRRHVLLPLCALSLRLPSIFPRRLSSWLDPSSLPPHPPILPRSLGTSVYLQPATLDYLADIFLDDTRAQKLLGYSPQWKMLQSIRWVVEEAEKQGGGAGTVAGGMRLKDV